MKIENKNIIVTKFTGILLNNHLSWKSHTSHIFKIVYKYNGIIRKIRPYFFKPGFPPHFIKHPFLSYLSDCTNFYPSEESY